MQDRTQRSGEHTSGPKTIGENRSKTETGEAEDRPGLAFDELDDRLAQFASLRKSDSTAAEDLLGEIGASDSVDRQIILELSARRPLGHPDRFMDAHTLAVRSLEVLDRNASHGISMPAWGPLTGLARWFVQLVTNFLVRRHVSRLIDHLHRLYASREANCLPGDRHRMLLIRARRDMERLDPRFRRNPLGIPAFLLGGAVLGPLVSWIQGLLSGAGSSGVLQVVFGLLAVGLFWFAAWVLLRGAAVARVRIRLTTEQPVDALLQTVGRCGDQPGDQARIFAFVAIILTAVTGVVVPLLIIALTR